MVVWCIAYQATELQPPVCVFVCVSELNARKKTKLFVQNAKEIYGGKIYNANELYK